MAIQKETRWWPILLALKANSVLTATLTLLLCISSVAASAEDEASKAPQKTIAVVEFMQETNSFSTVPTTLFNFQRRGNDGFESMLWYHPDEILNHNLYHETIGHVAGFLKAVQDVDINQEFSVVPILQARSVSGGPVKAEDYQHFETHILEGVDRLLQTTNLQGIYLSLHGAMGVEGRTDPEGDLLQAIRERVGSTLPIGVSHDLHANLTQKRMSLMTFLVGYRTNPHRDFYNAGYQSGKILIQTIQGVIRPTMVYKKMRMLRGGGWTIDFLWPMRQVFNWMRLQEKQNSKVLYLSTFMVHTWLDHEELGWSTVAVTDNDLALAEHLSSELADLNWETRTAASPTGLTPTEALQQTQDAWIRRMFGTTVWCDASDAVGAGAPGESTWILKTLLDHQDQVLARELAAHDDDKMEATNLQPLVSYITLRDTEAVDQVFDSRHQIGDNVTLQVGGKLDLQTNHPVVFSGTIVKRIHETNDDNGSKRVRRIAVLQYHGVHLILDEVPTPLHSPAYWTHTLGLSLWQADIVVVKNLFPFRYRYLLYNRMTLDVVTRGVTNIDIYQIPYTKIPRPIYPLDAEEMDNHFDNTSSWKPEYYDNYPGTESGITADENMVSQEEIRHGQGWETSGGEEL